MPWMVHRRVMAVRRRSAPVDVLVEALDGYRRHLTGRNAALLAYYGFLSVFPLMLVATTILGFVLQGNPELQQDIVGSALSQLPFIGQQIASDPARLHGSVAVLVIALLGALWAGMRAFVGIQTAQDDIWEIDIDHRANLAVTRGRALLGIAIVGGAQLATAFAASLAAVSGVAWISRIGLFLATMAINIGVLGTVYHTLTNADVPWRRVWPGAAFAGTVFTILQLLGTAVVGRAIKNASPVYGNFASVIALTSWLGLHASASLIGVELNAAMVRRDERSASAAATDHPD